MERTVHEQLRTWTYVRERGLQLWLVGSWETFRQGNLVTGHLTNFLLELQHGKQELIFVPTKSWQQGSPSNPFLARSEYTGYHVTVQPRKVAERLMARREQLAHDWREELQLLAAGASSAVEDDQLLAGLATRIALRAMVRELSLRPSQAPMSSWISELLKEHSKEMDIGGDVEEMLREIERLPVCIRGKSLCDPFMIVQEIKGRRVQIAEDMATFLESTEVEHHAMKSAFLDKCFQL